MCYKFYVPDDLRNDVLEDMLEQLAVRNVTVATGDVTPGKMAAVIASSRALKTLPFGMRWGYRLSNGKLVYNTRSETAAQKSLFCDGIAHRRCLIPAAHYYERADKTQYTIFPREKTGLLLAGIYRLEGSVPVFSVLTRPPAQEIALIHDRMPVLIPPEAARDWLNPRYHGLELLPAIMPEMDFREC